MPDSLKAKLSEKPVAANLLPDDRLVVLRRPQDEADASRRNLTVGLAALQAWLGLAAGTAAQRLTLLQAQALAGTAVREQLYLLTGTPAAVGQTAGTWNASGTSQAIYVPGYATYFGREGVLLDADGQPVGRVSVDVAAGTYAPLADAGANLPTVDLLDLTTDFMLSVMGLTYTDCDAAPADSPDGSLPGQHFDAIYQGKNCHFYCSRGTYDPAAPAGTTGEGPAWHYFIKLG